MIQNMNGDELLKINGFDEAIIGVEESIVRRFYLKLTSIHA